MVAVSALRLWSEVAREAYFFFVRYIGTYLQAIKIGLERIAFEEEALIIVVYEGFSEVVGTNGKWVFELWIDAYGVAFVDDKHNSIFGTIYSYE